MIKYVSHNEIDKEKWDACIEKSGTGLIYGFSWYLDLVSPMWDALVFEDYTAVMPLTWSAKWGIKYLFPPMFTQQLGVFSIAPPAPALVDRFINTIHSCFRYIEINLNVSNHAENKLPCKIKMQSNHEIVLSASYEQLFCNYNRNCKRNINKAIASGMIVQEGIAAKTFVDFFKKNLDLQLKMLRNKDYKTLETLIGQSLEQNKAEIYGAYTSMGELCGIALFFITSQRCIFSVCASSEEGKKNQAMYLLVNHQINKYAGSDKVFDFSGSNIPGIAYFNSTFGAMIRTYPRIKLNRLPWPLKFFKK